MTDDEYEAGLAVIAAGNIVSHGGRTAMNREQLEVLRTATDGKREPVVHIATLYSPDQVEELLLQKSLTEDRAERLAIQCADANRFAQNAADRIEALEKENAALKEDVEEAKANIIRLEAIIAGQPADANAANGTEAPPAPNTGGADATPAPEGGPSGPDDGDGVGFVPPAETQPVDAAPVAVAVDAKAAKSK